MVDEGRWYIPEAFFLWVKNVCHTIIRFQWYKADAIITESMI